MAQSGLGQRGGLCPFLLMGPQVPVAMVSLWTRTDSTDVGLGASHETQTCGTCGVKVQLTSALGRRS